MIKAIFWDNDGVLVDTERLYFEANRRILAPLGLDLTAEMFVEFFLRQGKGAWHLVEEQGFNQDEIQKMRNFRNALYAELLMKQSRTIDGAEEVLRALHGTYVMGVVTSSRKDHFAMIHRNSALLRYMAFVLADGDYAKHKPEPDPYRAATARSGCRPEECVAIEDSERGLAAAHAAGIHCFVIPTELTKDGDFSKADRVLQSIKEVPRALK